jgi:hypothetical protein
MPRAALLALFAVGLAAVARSAAPEPIPRVAVLRSAAWSPGDTVRDGAGEFAVFLTAARLQRAHRAAGLVAVCDRHGLLRTGGETALRRLVHTGLAIVKLTPAAAAVDPHPGFLQGGTLGEEQAAAILVRCLDRYGPPPAAADPEDPSPAELAALRSHLAPFQAALDAAVAPRLASR